MRTPGGGYTIIEVLIFLAISSLLFVAAMVAVGGQQAHAEFTSAVNDVNIKFQQWISDVNNGFSASTATPTGSDYVCEFGAGGFPALVKRNIGNQRGANPDCVFMGKVIQVTGADSGLGPGQDPRHIYAYSVLGRRVDGQGNLITSFTDAQPIAAIFPDVPGGDLTEDYTIPNGARVKWVRSGSSLESLRPNSSHLGGFFTSFNTSGSTVKNGSQALLAVQYPFNSDADPRSAGITQCISLDNRVGCGTAGLSQSNPWPMEQWVVCLESTRNSDTAAISIVSTNGNGATTKVTIPCPGS